MEKDTHAPAKTDPRMSVVILSCNREVEIVRTLDAIGLQTFKDLEVIVVDQASVDRLMTRIRMITLKHYLERRWSNVCLIVFAKMFFDRPYSWKARSVIGQIDLGRDLALLRFKHWVDPFYCHNSQDK